MSQFAAAGQPMPPYSMPNQPGMPMHMGNPAPQDYKDPNRNAVRGLASPKIIFIGTGVTLLAFLCIVPVWNAFALLQDINYVFWQGRSLPTWMIANCFAVALLYVVVILAFFSYARPQVQTEQTIMMIANIFITLLGLILMLLSLPLSQQSIDTYQNLMHKCDYSEQTHRMYEYSQVLHNIRRTPLCATKYSVEECAGYEDAPPYTTFLKAMESDFRCSGFCYKPPSNVVAAQVGQAGHATKAGARNQTTMHTGHTASLAQRSRVGRHHQEHGLSPDAPSAKRSPSLLQRQNATPSAVAAVVQTSTMNEYLYPPTLFSDANYQASCEGMAARDMKNFAGDVGFQTFYQGIYLVLIAIATGFLKLVGYCVKKDHNKQNSGH